MSREKKTRDDRQFSDYREYLLTYLEKKKKNNVQYSMRAFARDLGISPSTLSETLNRHHGLTPKSSEKIADRLNLSASEKSHFLKLVKLERYQIKKKQIKPRPDGKEKINLDAAIVHALENNIGKYESPDGEIFISVNYLRDYLSSITP